MDTIIEFNAGNLTVFNEIYAEYSVKLYDFIYFKTGSDFYANEVTQMTFIKLWERHADIRADIPLAIQLFRTAKTTLIDVLRKVERERAKINSSDRIGILVLETTGEELMNEYDSRKVLNEILRRMPPMRRKVLHLKVEQFSYEEIASALSISIKTVNKHLELARKQIKPFLNLFFLLSFFSAIIIVA